MGVDIQTYRCRIGTFSYTSRKKPSSESNGCRITQCDERGRKCGSLQTIALVVCLSLYVFNFSCNLRNTAFDKISISGTAERVMFFFKQQLPSLRTIWIVTDTMLEEVIDSSMSNLKTIASIVFNSDLWSFVSEHDKSLAPLKTFCMRNKLYCATRALQEKLALSDRRLKLLHTDIEENVRLFEELLRVRDVASIRFLTESLDRSYEKLFVRMSRKKSDPKLVRMLPYLSKMQSNIQKPFQLCSICPTANDDLAAFFVHTLYHTFDPCAQPTDFSFAEYINEELRYVTTSCCKDTGPTNLFHDPHQSFRNASEHDAIDIATMETVTSFNRDEGENELWYVWDDVMPIRVIKAQLISSGVEPNPGPAYLTDFDETKTIERLVAKKQTRDTYFHFGKVQACTGSIKVGSIFGTNVFKIELIDDLRKGLLNKNNKKAKEFAISRILDELCNFGEFVELDIPPLFYLRKHIAYMVLPSASWWRDLDATVFGRIPAGVLAYRNEFRETFFFRDKHTMSLLDEHISNTHLSSINFCDITVANPFGGFLMITCNNARVYPHRGERHDKPPNQPELKYPTQVSEAQEQRDSSASDEENSLDEDPSLSHQNNTHLSVNQTGTFCEDHFSENPQIEQIDRPHVQINMTFNNPWDDGMRFNRNTTEHVQDIAPRFKMQQRRYPTAKYVSYENEGSRRETYRGWPLQQPDPQTLCNAGFFFTGQSYDLVRCFCCGIGLKDFSDSDNPLLEHAKHSSNCPYLLDQFGSREALEMYKQNNARPDPEDIRRRQRELYQQQQGRPVTNYRAKHERFRSLSSRIDTFINWPPHLSQRPQQLAEAGLYYTGIDDHCRCFACDGGLRKWESGDDPWIEHCRWFPACPYAREIKGDEFIDLIQVSADLVASEATSAQHEELNGVMAAITIDDRLVQRIVDTHRHILTFDMGFLVDDVRNAVLELVQQGSSDPDIGEIVTRIEVIRERKSLEEKLIMQPTPCTQSEDTLMEQNQRLKSILLCHVCHKNQINALFLPCTHRKYCLECTEHIDRCPDCTRPIKERIRTFMG
ncbi:uncharacterized protein LOC127834837 isoform X2 [Dreissena polymorpha]|uniref:RING-type domain-containing protein n=2 Tax=Dreissena polymorpha TaxID=45954 RepID=A0A9D4JGF9_DREPO|nr:uncharacterized protein LOC127834837 isoform X2 [Dreissena polymorpha]XP_052216860.1 uncharacterized protein LOC127834837 isoform X2 [Dreissena polymorpha]XP_052216861.1 uncharacterized protein LOC127834837 isoform X2 [Dreissena polymorpha]KAH3806752.1 hypothetical protein DPMN_135077 [Dreissena polymorpha]